MSLGKFQMNDAGVLEAPYRFGFKGFIRYEGFENGLYQGEIRDERGELVWMCRDNTKTAVRARMGLDANEIFVERNSAYNGQPLLVSINTPLACDPSCETYWSM